MLNSMTSCGLNNNICQKLTILHPELSNKRTSMNDPSIQNLSKYKQKQLIMQQPLLSQLNSREILIMKIRFFFFCPFVTRFMNNPNSWITYIKIYLHFNSNLGNALVENYRRKQVDALHGWRMALPHAGRTKNPHRPFPTTAT